MKKYINILLAACFAFILVGCSDDNEAALTPEAAITVDKTDLSINESMEIHFTGVADQVVVYTGDKGHEYALRNETNTGYPVNKGLFTYAYSVPGTFHVVVVATTYETFSGEGLRNSIKEFDVTVVDDCTTIDKLYSNITPNVYYADLVNDNDWVICLPTKQVYNGREISLKATKQRLSFEIASDSSKIYVDEVLYKSNTYYDLTKVHNIHVVSDAGPTRDYSLYGMIYPEFSSVKVAGVAGALTRDAFYQDLLTYSFTLPEGTDKTSVTLEYGVDGDVKFFANGSEIASGSAIDLTDESVSYTMVRTLAENTAVTAVSRVVFSVQ